MNANAFKSRKLFVDFVVTGILLISFVSVPLSMLVESVAAAPEDILTPKQDWGVNGVKYGMGSTSSGVLIADVRTDIPGEEVIVVGIDWVRALNGTDGSTIWERNLPEVWYWTQPQMADLNLDGISEVIVPFGDWPPGGNGLYVLHGNNGSTYWETRGDLGGNSIVGSLVIGDIDGDGYPTIFVATEDINHELEGTGRLTALDHLGNVTHQTFIWRPCAGGLSLADGDNDGVYELYMGDRDMYMGDGDFGKGVRSFWAENLSVRWNHPDVLCSSQAPPLADVNGDGILDVIVSNQRGGVLVLDSRTGSAIRKDVSRRDLPTHYQGSIYDIDGDGNLEILFADGDHGSTPDDCAVFDLVEWEVDGRFDVGLCHYGPQVADVTGDGNMDIIATSFNGIHIINPQTYTVIDNVTGLGGVDEKLQNAVVQDIDDDGLVEVVVSSESGTVWAFDTPAPSPQERGLPRARSEVQFYSERRLGAAEYVPPPGQEPEPVISSPFPSHKASNVPVSISQLRFTLKDYQDNQMNFTVVTSPNVGSDSGTDVDSGTEIVVDVVESLDYYAMYTWEAKVTDGTYWTNRTFRFTTEFESVSNQPPTHDPPLIEGGALTTYDNLISYNQTTADSDGDEVTNIYNWYRNDVSFTNLLLPFDTRNATMARDYSGYGNDATIRGATWTSEGIVGGAYEFNGDDYIMIPHSSSLGADGTWSEITIEHWIYFSQDQDGTRTIAKIPSYEIGFQTGRNNRIFAGVWTDNGARQTSTYTLGLDTWYHVAMTYKDGEGLILYVNGINRRSRSWSGTIKASAGSRPETHEPLYLGWFDFFEGKMDEVRIYPKALSPEQIYQRYNETKDGLSNNSTIVAQDTKGRDSWKSVVTPNDGLVDGLVNFSNTITLANTPPVASNLRFPQRTRSEFALSTENLTAVYDYYDADDDPESGTEILWYKDGALQGAYNDLLSIDSIATAAGEVWNLTVMPSDGEDFGTLQNSSNILIIENDPPTHDNPLLISSGGTDRLDEELISYNQTTADSGGDEVTNIYNWYVNGTSMTNLLLPFDTDAAMTVKDYSGYGNDGNISGATWTSDGLIGGAYFFDGDDVITIEDDATLGGYGTWSEISIEFWVKTAAPLHGTRIIGRKVASASTGSYMVGFQTSMGDPANTVFWGIDNGPGWEDIWNTTTTVLDVGKWYHVLCTYESGPGLTIYINGIQRVNRPLTGNIDYDPDEMLFIGTSGESASNRWLNGTLDEVRIYPIALTPAQIFQRYLETRDGLSNSSTIVPLETTEGDEWKCEITPNDSWQDGTTNMSNTLTILEVIGNSQPRIDVYTPSNTIVQVNEGDSLEFTHISSDPDGDLLNYSWLLDSVEQNTTQNWTYLPGFEDAGTYNVTLKVDDGEFFDSQQWTVTVVPMSQLTIQVAGNGTTSPVPDVYVYDEGTDVSVDAIPDGGWMLDHWLLDDVDVGNETSYMVTMDSDHNLTAVFVEIAPIQFEDAYLVVRGLNDRIYYRIYNASGGSWEGWNVVPNGMTCDSPTAAVYSGKLYIVVRGMDGQSLWFGWINLTDNDFFGWTRLSGATPSAPTLVHNDSRLVLVVRGSNNRIYYRFYNCTSDEWEGWIVVPTGVTCDSPAATILANELHIMVRGISASNSSMWHGRLNLTTEIFLGWTRLGGATESAPTLAASQTSNRLCLTVRGLNNSTYYNTWNGTGWEGWTVVPSRATCDSPAATIIGDELHVVVRGMDDYSLWHYNTNLSTSAHSGWTRISGATQSAPTLTS